MKVSDIRKLGRPPIAYPRRAAVYLRFSDIEFAALERACAAEFPVASRRPPLVTWLRDLAVAHASEVLQVQVTRSGLRHLDGGAPDWQRWRLSKAVRRAATRRRRPR